VTRILELDIYDGRLRVAFVDDDGKPRAVLVERADADEDDTMLKNPGVGRVVIRNAIFLVNSHVSSICSGASKRMVQSQWASMGATFGQRTRRVFSK
jgi:hypothetical protein